MIQAISHTTTSAESVRGILDLLELHDGHDSALDRCGLKPDDVRRLTASMRPAPAPKLAPPAPRRSKHRETINRLLSVYEGRLQDFRAAVKANAPQRKLQELAKRCQNKVIARDLKLPAATVSNHLGNALAKRPDLRDDDLRSFGATACRYDAKVHAERERICGIIIQRRLAWNAMSRADQVANVEQATCAHIAKELGVKPSTIVSALTTGVRNKWITDEHIAIGEAIRMTACHVTTAKKKGREPSLA